MMKDKKKIVNKIIPRILLGVSIALIIVGIRFGQNQDVMQKAIRICLECVGIG